MVTAASTLYYLYRKQFAFWRERGYDVLGVAAPGEGHDLLAAEGVATRAVAMVRTPSPLRDVVSLARLWWLLVTRRFDVVHVSTLKAGLLGAIAARLSGHRNLVYTVRGRAYENMTGLRRRVFAACEWLTCRLARRVVPICRELGRALVDEGLCPAEKIRTIGSGSSNGIDLARFTPTEATAAAGRDIRKRLGVGEKDLLILFAGRIRREKGVNELVTAFDELAARDRRVHLLLLGSVEGDDPLRPEVTERIAEGGRIHQIDWLAEPVPAYAAADIVVLPSYREGFGNVCLEAGAMGLPVVASDILGCREAVERDGTGLLVRPRDAGALRDGLARLIGDARLRRKLGRAGRCRVEREFRQEIVWDGIARVYEELLGGGGDGVSVTFRLAARRG